MRPKTQAQQLLLRAGEHKELARNNLVLDFHVQSSLASRFLDSGFVARFSLSGRFSNDLMDMLGKVIGSAATGSAATGSAATGSAASERGKFMNLEPLGCRSAFASTLVVSPQISTCGMYRRGL